MIQIRRDHRQKQYIACFFALICSRFPNTPWCFSNHNGSLRQVKIPSSFSVELRDLVKNLLQVDITKRFGNMKSGIADIKGHEFFTDIDWIGIYKRQVRNK